MTDQTTIKAILIDPYQYEDIASGSVWVRNGDLCSEIEVKANDLDATYAALSTDLHPVHTIDAVYLENGDLIYLDDNGLFSPAGDRAQGFAVKDLHQPFFGRGLLVGSDDEGRDTAPKTTLKEAKSQIEFAGALYQYRRAS